jgi:hypothetical protein
LAPQPPIVDGIPNLGVKAYSFGVAHLYPDLRQARDGRYARGTASASINQIK